MAKNENSTHEEIMPGKWKTWLNNERYCNPATWEFKILKRTSFSPSMMKSMFSKYWNPPQMKSDGQRETEDGKEATPTLADGGKNAESQNGKDGTNEDQIAVIEHDQNKSDRGNEARENPEVLSANELQDLKEALIGQIRILWIGHASLLIQMEGRNILTDPIFSSKAGPKNKIGYSRYRKPAVTVEMLKDLEIDAVVISHNHYDHFDKQSVMDLNTAFPYIKWYVPMKLKSDLTSLGCDNVYEATWWQSLEFDEGITFHFTPAKHWSGRNPTDWYTSLWGSWVIEGKTAKVYFAGDTGYQEEIFKAIRDKFGPITIAALPIGAYEPREMMKCQHINPDEAVQIHNILDVQKSIGIHWRTFQLSCEGIDQPVHDLEVAKTAHGVGKEDFITLEKSLITTIECKKLDDTQQEGSEPDLCSPD